MILHFISDLYSIDISVSINPYGLNSANLGILPYVSVCLRNSEIPN